MRENRDGPFRKGSNREHQELRVNSSWALAALALIAISQVPIALQSTIEIYCIVTSADIKSSKIVSCK